MVTILTCPLCGNAAKFEFTPHCIRKHFLCDVCGEFLIDSDVEHRWERTAGLEDVGAFYSDRAKNAPAGKVLVIGTESRSGYFDRTELPNLPYTIIWR